MIVAMTEVASMLVGEAAVHDAALVKLDLAPLPKGASGDAFSKRVTDISLIGISHGGFPEVRAGARPPADLYAHAHAHAHAHA